jgi:hypothetical protein
MNTLDPTRSTAKQRSYALALTKELGLKVKASDLKKLDKKQMASVIADAIQLKAERAEQEANR